MFLRNIFADSFKYVIINLSFVINIFMLIESKIVFIKLNEFILSII